MKVNPNRDLPETAPLSRASTKVAAPATQSPSDFAASAKLALKLAATPEVRTERVTRAKELIADSNYPTPKTIRAVAKKLAENIQASTEAE